MDRPAPLSALAACPVWDGLNGGTLVVACSGGRDSVALACAAAALLRDPAFSGRFAQPPRLVLWHLDHGLREQSPQDRRFVEELALKLEVLVQSERAELGQRLKAEGGNVEEVARQERYRRLLALLRDPPAGGPVRQPARAVTAHHLGDQAETVLYHAVRGTHLGGLRGIAPVLKTLVYRPWLDLPPEEIEAYLAALGQDFVTDQTNLDVSRSRNLLRQEVLPVLRMVNPRARQHLARLADIARTAHEYVSRVLDELPVEEFGTRAVDRWLPLTGWPAGDYDVYRLEEGWADPGVLAAFAARCLKDRTRTLSAADHDAVAHWADDPGTSAVVRGYRLQALGSRLFALAGPREDTTPAQPLVLELGASVPVGGLRVSLGKPEPEDWERQGRREPHPWEAIRQWAEALDRLTASPPVRPVWRCFLPAGIELPLVLRSWRAADRITLPAGGSKKVGDVFTDAKVPACFREVWAVLAGGDDRPLWVPGLADGAAMQLPRDATPAFVVSIRESR